MTVLPSRSIYLVRHGSPDKAFEIRDETLRPPGEGEVSISVEASGINFADILARQGLYPEAPKPPCILGYEVVGSIEKVGPEVDQLKPGDRALAFTRFGGYASRVVVPQTNVIPIPDTMNAGVATALGTQYCTAWYAAEKMVTLQEGDRVLIQAAAGGVGSALAQIAKRRGCIIFGTAGSNSKLEYLKELGVDHPINYRENDFAEEITRILGDQGLDVVFDSIGGKTFLKGKRLLGAGGRIVTFGVAQMAGKRKSYLRPILTFIGFGLIHALPLLVKSQGVIGVNLLRIADKKPEVLRQCMKEVMGLAIENELRPKVGAIFPAEKIADAHAFVENRASTGKVILDWTV